MASSDFYCDEVLSGRTSVKKVRETTHVLAFYHTRPYWPVHIVVIPKRHIASLLALTPTDKMNLVMNCDKTALKRFPLAIQSTGSGDNRVSVHVPEQSKQDGL